MTVAEFDATAAPCIDDAAAARYREDGLLVLRSVLSPQELTALQAETQLLVDDAVAGRQHDRDFKYKRHDVTGEEVPFRVEYVVDKLDATKALLGHPFLLRTVEALQGPDFIPTWDSMVFKMEGAGAAIPWHRDGGLYEDSVPLLADGRVFNVDIYLDRADLSSCLWGIPRSNHWPDERAWAVIAERNGAGVDTTGAAPLLMDPGDVLIHSVMVLHGSQATAGPLRRVIYYEFRPVDLELELGPHSPDYVPLKQHVLIAALRYRATRPWSAGEQPFVYRASVDAGDEWTGDPPAWRYPHEAYLRKVTAG